MKHKFFTLFVVLTLFANFSLATDYYYRGNDNSWGATKMTPSEDGLYAYIQSSNSSNQFKIATSVGGWDYNYSYVSKGFNGTDVSKIGDYSGDNCYCWQSGTYYILIYYPNMYNLNTSSKPKICASTTLPKKSWYIKTAWNGGSWSWQKMTTPASGSEYTYEGKWGDMGCNINTTNSDDNSGWIDKTKISGYASFSKGNDVIFTYNPQTNSLSVTDKEYEVQVATEDANKGTVSHSWVYAHPYSQVDNTITATPQTGYAFDRWEGSEGVNVTSPSSASTTLKASQAGTVTAYFKAATTYAISYCEENHFTFTNKSTTKAAADETVSFSISINEGCKLNSVTVLDAAQGNPVECSLQHDGNGNYTFTMPAEAVTISVMAAEDLTTGFKIKGTFDTWTSHDLTKKTGHAAEKIGYYTYTLDANTTYEFGIVRNSDDKFYKNGGTYTSANNGQWWTFPNKDNLNNCKLQTAVAGEYVFAVDYSEDTQGTEKIKVQITYPTEKFYEVTVTDNAGTEVKSIGDVTPVAITAADKEEYRFTSWTIDPEANIHIFEGSATTKTISITATGAATLTANYEELPKVYFDNTLGWEKVYVYFNAYWDEYHDPSRGAGAKGQPYGQMKQIGETNRYYYAYDVASPSAQIAFASADMHDYDNFYGHKAVYRADFNACRPVFTPDAAAETKTYNTTTYYNSGYWQTVDTHTGMYFVYTDNWVIDPDREFIRQDASATRGMMSINLDEGTYEFKIKTCAGLDYGNKGKIITNIGLDGGGWVFERQDGNCKIVANAAGTYTFYYDFYSRELWVIYPTYYLKHAWPEGEHQWSWKNCDIYNEDTKTYSLYANYRGTGVNYNTKASDEGSVYCTTDNGRLILVGDPQVDKPARFTFDPKTANVTIENMYFPITMNKFGYSTLYHKENLQIPEGVTAKYVTGTEGVLLTYQEVQGGVIPKNTGVMLFALDMKNEVMEFVGVAKANEEAPENIMAGSHEAEVVDNQNIHYILSTTSAGQVGMLWPKNTDEGVGSFNNAANKAYMELPGEQTQPAAVMARKGFLLANDVNTPTELVDVNANTNVNGKVLRNGQLIIIRDGIKYNALGEIVK